MHAHGHEGDCSGTCRAARESPLPCPPARRCRLSRRLMALKLPASPALPHGRSRTPVQPARRIPSGGRMVAARRLFYRVSSIDCMRHLSSNDCCVLIAGRHLHSCARLPAQHRQDHKRHDTENRAQSWQRGRFVNIQRHNVQLFSGIIKERDVKGYFDGTEKWHGWLSDA